MLPGISMPMVGMTEHAIEKILGASSTGDFNVSTLFTSPEWTSDTKKRVIVPAGVTRGSLVRTTPVLRSGTGRGGVLEIVVDGTLEGCGAPATTTLVAGLDGGDCILAEQSGVLVLGSGAIKSGGGAGGKGGNGSSSIYDGSYIHSNSSSGEYSVVIAGYGVVAQGGGGGPTGGYYHPASGRQYYFTFSSSSNGDTYYSGYYVATTTSGAAGRGQGHDGAKSNGVAGGTNSGLSGNGGDWGAAGTAGAAGNNGSGTAAGLAGYALKNTSNITNLFTGTLTGRTG